jgi:phi13 family phage major tail protein
MLEEAGLPLAYDHFAEGESPDPPFLVFLYPGSDNMFADNTVFQRSSQLNIELYTDKKTRSWKNGLRTSCVPTTFLGRNRRSGSNPKSCTKCSIKHRLKEVATMANRKNKVKFGLKNCHYAIATLAEGRPSPLEALSGNARCRSLSLDAEGDNDPFYADDSVYYMVREQQRLFRRLELALMPESFLTDVMHETEDANGVMVENKDVEPEHFALLFEFSGDQRKIRHCMYYCSASRPPMEGDTTEDKKEVQDREALAYGITASFRPREGQNRNEHQRRNLRNWYNAVYQPQASTSEVTPTTTDTPTDAGNGESTDPATDTTE